MTNYPNSQDNNITLPGVSGVTQEDIAISALRDATFAIEKELGIQPSGIYSDVRARLDILESRIGFGIPSGVTNDGYILSPLILWNNIQDVTLTISDGYGFPTESRVNGSLYMRADGYANDDFYIRRDGYWVPIQTEAFIAAGDLMGNHLSQTVIGLYNKPLKPTMATVGATQDGYHLTWNNSDGYWEAQTGFIAASDLAADSAFFGRIGQRVVRFQNRTFSAVAPVGTTATNGSTIKWNSVQNQWEPQADPVVFVGSVNANDGYTTRVNISSNKIQQSPMSATLSKVGMINFGTSTTTIGGTSDNYAAILGGDQHTASGQFSLVVNGISSVASGLYSTVVNGPTNTASNTSATVINGNTNTASGIQSIVLDGYTNIAAATNSFIGNGGLNTIQAGALFSSILNGISNTVTAGSGHAGIGWGTNNVINSTGFYTVLLGGNGNTAGGLNTHLGTPALATALSDYGFIGTGLGNGTTTQKINLSSPFSVIVNGNGNIVSTSTQYGFIGTGNIGVVTGNYATILNGTTCTVDGLHATILNGNNNVISGSSSYATIVDGYSNTISGPGSFIGDGYTNIISGFYSSILNGNTNTVAGSYSTVLGGSGNIINITSGNSVVLNGILNALTNSSRSGVLGNNNTLTANAVWAMGDSNNISGQQSCANGNFNIVSAQWSAAWGLTNTVAGSLGYNSVFGQNNVAGAATGYNTVSGLNNTVDGYNSAVFGERNVTTTDGHYSLVQGKFARARISGQRSQAVNNFNGTTAGEVQFSRVILTGSGLSGSPFPTLVPGDGYLTFENGKAYDINIRVLIVNNQSPLVDPTKPARFIFDVLASQEAGTLTIHDQNNTLVNQNGTGWSVTVVAVGNQLQVNVDVATFPQSPVPFNTSNRRAIVTVEWREITRV